LRTGSEFSLRGTVDRNGQSLLVNAELVHTREGLVLWSTTMRRDAADAPLLQQQLATFAAAVVRCSLTLRKVVQYDQSIDQFAIVLSFCDAALGGRIEPLPEIARRLVEAAPHEAGSYALQALANARVSRLTAFRFTARPPQESQRLRTLVYDSAKRALAMEPNGQSAALAYLAEAIVFDPAVSLAEREKYFQKALSLHPANGYAYFDYALFLTGVGRIEEARTYVMRSLNVEPLNYDGVAFAAYLSAVLGDVAAARDQFNEIESKAMFPADSDVPLWFEVEFAYGDPAVARKMAAADDRVLRRNSDDPDKSALACMNAFLDARSNSVRPSEDEIEAACASNWFWDRAFVHAYFEHVDWIFRQPRDDRDFWDFYPFFHSLHFFLPEFRAVRADPRFMAFIVKTGRVDYWLDTDQWPDFCKEEKLPYDCKETAVAARAQVNAERAGG